MQDFVQPDEAPSSTSPRKATPRKKKASAGAESSIAKVSPSPPAKKKRKVASSPSTKPKLASDQVASILPGQPFIDLEVPPEELRCSATLTNGQCFHWMALDTTTTTTTTSEIIDDAAPTSAWGTHDATEWIGTLRTASGKSFVLVIKETRTTTLYRPLTPLPDGLDLKEFLRDYFQLDDNLQKLYKEWSQADDRLKIIAKCIPGARQVDQDPWECLVSFICSSNNNIPRITQMVNALRREYGTQLLSIGEDFAFFSFPSLEELSQATDSELRGNCGMGYRSKYLLETMKILERHGGESYLHDLKDNYRDQPDLVQEKLTEFHGVGRKVADCIALFSLKQASAIPVDVHVWQIALRDYDDSDILKQAKSLTPTIYQHVVDIFRTRFPNKAGWAHSLLFLAELPSFRAVLPADMVDEMDRFKEAEATRKKSGAASASTTTNKNAKRTVPPKKNNQKVKQEK